MAEKTERSQRIVKNTLLLYVRTFFLMIISLYTSRIILNALGVVDYGIYNVVGGVVTMFSMISGSLSTAISRFLTFAIGKRNIEKLNDIFSTSVNIQLILGLVIVLFAETIGLWFLKYKMVIPEDRVIAAFWVYQFSILTFVINLISIPYNAVIIAHEHMSAFAYISILEGVGKLVIAFSISVSPINRLVFFALMTAALGVIIRLTYGWYCKKHFPESSYHFKLNRKLLQEMFGFAGWNFLSSSAMILREYGGNIVINLFCGPAVNASRAIAAKVNTTVQGFITNFTMAVNPQITKSYAAGDYEYMLKLIYQGSRLSFYMMFILSLPIILNAHYILQLWLGFVPEYTVSFVCLILLLAMSDILSNTLITSILATGRVRNYQIVVSSAQLMNLPISYVCLRLGCAPESVIIVSIIISNVALFLRLYMVSKSIPIKPYTFLHKVYLNVLVVGLISSILPFVINTTMNEGFWRFITTTIVSIISCMLVILYIGCDKGERVFVKTKITNFIQNKINKNRR